MDGKILGKNIVKYRTKLNMTQEKLSEQIEISNVFLSQIENGVRKPSLATLIKLSEVFRVPIDSLLGLNISLQDTRFNGILTLLADRTDAELALIEDVCRTLCAHMHGNQVMPNA